MNFLYKLCSNTRQAMWYEIMINQYIVVHMAKSKTKTMSDIDSVASETESMLINWLFFKD